MIERSSEALTKYLSRYNISKTQYNAMVKAQGGSCKICGSTEDLVLDHDHACCNVSAKSCGKCVRGLLCESCNLFLGHADDDVKRLANAIVYLYNTGTLYK